MISFFKKKPAASPPSIPDGVLVYAIGDIHGRLDCLDPVFDAIDADPLRRDFDSCHEVYLGDYIDRGGQSKHVIDALIARGNSASITTLKGNHESFMLDAMADQAAVESWRELGGLETITSYGPRIALPLTGLSIAKLHAEWLSAVPDQHVAFLSELPLFEQIGDYFFCHAGVRPGIKLDMQVERDLLWIRDEFLTSMRWHGARIVHGHTPVQEPDFRANRINIDTGAYMTGHLTCLRLHGTQADVI